MYVSNIGLFPEGISMNSSSRDNLLQILLDFETHIDCVFDELIHNRWRQMEKGKHWEPHTDVIETADEVVVLIDLPGINPKEVTVRRQDNVLEIYGVREEEVMRTTFRHLSERKSGPFKRRVELDDNSEYSAQMHIDYRNGVFMILIEKEHENNHSEQCLKGE
ncbi:MAG: Hsp20 family protein [Chitinivibrionales bacterium]|nr:Hsp20 family protein [Chitinivibrionales bacterium]